MQLTALDALVASRARDVLGVDLLHVPGAVLAAHVVDPAPNDHAVALNVHGVAHVPAADPGAHVVAQNDHEVDLADVHGRAVAPDVPVVVQGAHVADPDAHVADLARDAHTAGPDAPAVDRVVVPVVVLDALAVVLDPDVLEAGHDVRVAALVQDVLAVDLVLGDHAADQADVPAVDLDAHAADQDAHVVDQGALVADLDPDVHAVARAPGAHDHAVDPAVPAVDLDVHEVVQSDHAVVQNAPVVAQHAREVDLKALPRVIVKVNQKETDPAAADRAQRVLRSLLVPRMHRIGNV